MIEPNEIRIGNYFHYDKNSGYIGKVEGIYKYDDKYRIRLENTSIDWGADLKLSQMQPIPLTEEWLLKFGFKDNGYYYYIKSFKIAWAIRIIKTNIKSGFSEVKNSISLRHVHQLQNLYFALTNKELTIKDYETTKG
jgi:hypothetical protein